MNATVIADDHATHDLRAGVMLHYGSMACGLWLPTYVLRPTTVDLWFVSWDQQHVTHGEHHDHHHSHDRYRPIALCTSCMQSCTGTHTHPYSHTMHASRHADTHVSTLVCTYSHVQFVRMQACVHAYVCTRIHAREDVYRHKIADVR